MKARRRKILNSKNHKNKHWVIFRLSFGDKSYSLIPAYFKMGIQGLIKYISSFSGKK